jgi:ribosomal protein S18 acetylase RimI-like enzyme
MKIVEFTSVELMIAEIDTIRFLYPEMTIEKYQKYLNDMIPNGYKQVAVFENNQCVALSGYWYNTKLWTGPYLEIDNFIVHPDHRKKGLGKKITDYIDEKAKELSCTCIVLDAFSGNFEAHRFYYNQGYEPRGFHFIKTIDKNGFS